MSENPKAHSLRIFVIEDHAESLEALTLFLTRRGHVVESAQSVDEAEAKLPHSDCQLILSDIQLPDGTGWDLLASGCVPPGRYAVAMSGCGSESDQAQSKAVGFKAHLVKPMRLADVENVLAEARAAMGFPPS
jgi:CheY-like chemotaxis protein